MCQTNRDKKKFNTVGLSPNITEDANVSSLNNYNFNNISNISNNVYYNNNINDNFSNNSPYIEQKSQNSYTPNLNNPSFPR